MEAVQSKPQAQENFLRFRGLLQYFIYLLQKDKFKTQLRYNFLLMSQAFRVPLCDAPTTLSPTLWSFWNKYQRFYWPVQAQAPQMIQKIILLYELPAHCFSYRVNTKQ